MQPREEIEYFNISFRNNRYLVFIGISVDGLL